MRGRRDISPEETPEYSFCLKDGSLPEEGEEDYPPAAFVDIGGEYLNDPEILKTKEEWKKAIAEVIAEREGREINPDDLTIIS